MFKRFLLLILLVIFFQFVSAQNEFITIWKPGNTQTPSPTGVPYNSSATQAWLPVQGNNYTIYWEEVGYPSHQATLTNVTSISQILIDFGTPLNPNPQNATYRVKISNGSGTFHKIQFTTQTPGNGLMGDTKKIINVEQWGTIIWSSMERAFSGCSLMDVTATDIPDLSNVDNMEYMFFNCSKLVATPTINNWNVSNVTNLQGTFMICPLFNQPLGNWNTSNVNTMAYTFFGATIFNQPIGNWNTSKVTLMIAMFNSAEAFNQPIGGWDLSENLNSEFMFSDAHQFNQPIGSWNISKLIETDHMFNNATAFNQDIGNWNTSSVKIMSGMFNDAVAFNQNIGNWNVGSAISMDEMFQNATSFNQNIGAWNTSNVSIMSGMFNGAVAFNQNIGNWNVGNVINMNQMFQDATNFNQNIGNWNVTNTKFLNNMFNHATHFNQNLEQWNLTSLLAAPNIFLNSGLNCENYNKILQGWSSNTTTPNNINMGSASPLIYSTSQAANARNNLINKGWTITGDTYNTECSLLATSNPTLTNTNEIAIYPNPATDFIYIKNAKGPINSYKVFDQSGRVVLQSLLNEEKINVSSLTKGNYILQIVSGDKKQSLKFLKN